MDNKSVQCCIIGSGPAGLATGLELIKNGINDIIIILEVINTCSKRGAFIGEELKVIGELYEKLKSVIDTVKSKDKKIDNSILSSGK